MENLSKRFFNNPKKWGFIIKEVNSLIEEFLSFDDEHLSQVISALKNKVGYSTKYEDYASTAIALFSVICKKVYGYSPHDEQVLGSIGLINDQMVEMKTGEGKTLTAAIAAYVKSLRGQGVHVITVNDYLVTRDAFNMARIYSKLGMSCGAVIENSTIGERFVAYRSDITYVSNSQIGFDYLKDNMKYSTNDMVLRGLNYCIVDEVDSVLIDEARTPLIVSGQNEDSLDIFQDMGDLAKLIPNEFLEINKPKMKISLTEDGVEYAEKYLENKDYFYNNNLYDNLNSEIIHALYQALKAIYLFEKDVDYIVKDNSIIVIDQLSGRPYPDRRYSDALHQALEVKEGFEPNPTEVTMASITYQNLFKLYGSLCGMSGTVELVKDEFLKVYEVETFVVPTHLPVKRKDNSDLFFTKSYDKFTAIVEEIKIRYQKKQPVLVGTQTIETSELISHLLHADEIPHVVLNAKLPEKEASIVAQAGSPGSITIATNMAGRGTDIILGGNMAFLEEEADKLYKNDIGVPIKDYRQEVINAGGLFVIGVGRNETRRIDDQLIGRSGRQGDVGESQFYISLEDKIFSQFEDSNAFAKLSKHLKSDAKGVHNKKLEKFVKYIQTVNEEQFADDRSELNNFDKVMSKQRELVYKTRLQIINDEDIDLIIQGIINNAVEIQLKTNFDISQKSYVWDENLFKEILYTQWRIDKSEADEILLLEDYDEIYEKISTNLWSKISTQLYAYLDAYEDESIFRNTILKTLDEYWTSHIRIMDSVRKTIGWTAYAGLRPIDEYNRMGFELYHALLKKIKIEITQIFVDFKA